MVRSRGLLLTASLGLLALFARPGLARADAWQLHVGDGLQYRLSNGQSAMARVVRVSSAPRQSIAELERITDGPGAPTVSHLRWLRNEQGLSVVFADPGDLPFERSPWLCLVWGAKLHDAWIAQRGRYRDPDGELVAYQVLARLEGIETVTVPAGTFAACYHVRFSCQLGEPPDPGGHTLDMWLVPELGLIKSLSGRDGSRLETELTGVIPH